MTKFDKEQFTWDGMYLMYRGRHSQSVNMEVARPGCHPSWNGLPQPSFIARFKYGSKPWKSWVKAIIENYTVEEYLAEVKSSSPLEAVNKVGYSGSGRYFSKKAAPVVLYPNTMTWTVE
ncbi:MAG: hypothetical protein ACKVJK_01915 [Methylophagaceae bacterium]